MTTIKVAVNGAVGKMGREVISAVCQETGLQLVGAVDLEVTGDCLTLPDGSGTVPFSSNLEKIITER